MKMNTMLSSAIVLAGLFLTVAVSSFAHAQDERDSGPFRGLCRCYDGWGRLSNTYTFVGTELQVLKKCDDKRGELFNDKCQIEKWEYAVNTSAGARDILMAWYTPRTGR